MFRLPYALAGFSVLTLLLSGCSTIIDGQTQDITIETPGAEKALCLLKTEGNSYKAYNDQTITIRRAKSNLLVSCQAAGNRERTVFVKRDVNKWLPVNVVNGFIPGAAYDYASDGAFEYPSKVVVSFAGVPVKPYDLPDYHDADLKYNNTYNRSENMGPTVIEMPERSGVSTLKKNTLPYGGSAPAVSDSSSVYQRSNSIVPYNPNEEIK